MKKTTRWLSLLTSFAVLLSAFPALAADSATIRGDAITVTGGQTVDYRVSISNNPGIAGFNIRLNFDTDAFVLEAESLGSDSPYCVQGDFSSKGTMICAATASGCQVLWYNTADVTGDGALFTVRLTAKETAPEGEYPIRLTYVAKDTINSDETRVPLECVSGSITVRSFAPVISVEHTEAVQGMEISCSVSIQDNPGIAGFRISLSYDTTALTPLTADEDTNALALAAGAAFPGTMLGSVTSDGCQVLWYRTTNVFDSGTAFTVRFRVDSNAPIGWLPISVSCSAEDTIDESETPVAFSTLDGGVNVTPRGAYTVSLDARGGTLDQTELSVQYDNSYGLLPEPKSDAYVFDGWYTAITGGEPVTAETIVSIAADHTLYAHWRDHSEEVEMDGVLYETLSEALAIADEKPVAISLLRNVTGDFTILSGQSIQLDLNGKTLNGSVTNYGTLTISSNQLNGQISTSGRNTDALVNHGHLTITSGSVYSDTRNGIYNQAGTVTIDGNASVTSYSSQAISTQSNAKTVISGGTVSSFNNPLRNYGTTEITGGRIVVAYGIYPAVINYAGSLAASGGEIEAKSGSCLWTEGGNVYLTGEIRCVSISGSDCIEVNRGTTEIDSGYFEVRNNTAVVLTGPGAVVVSGGYYKASGELFSASNLVYGEEKALSLIPIAEGSYAGCYFVGDRLGVQWLDLSGEVFFEEWVVYGTPFSDLQVPDGIPESADGAVFDGWQLPAVEIITEDLTISPARATAHGENYQVSFDPTGGELEETSLEVVYGEAYGMLPIPVREGFAFSGWFTDAQDGERVTYDSIVSIESAHTLHARWQSGTGAASVAGRPFATLNDALLGAAEQETIVLLLDRIEENPMVREGQSITINLNGQYLNGDIANHGTLIITDTDGKGRIYGTTAITNYGTLTADNCWISGASRGIVNSAGEANITGDCYVYGLIYAIETAKDSVTNIDGGLFKGSYHVIANRGEMNIRNGKVENNNMYVAVRNLSGTMRITDGSIENETGLCLSNEGGTVRLGGTLSCKSPGNGFAASYCISAENNTQTIINGGIYESTKSYAISGTGSVILNGGHFKAGETLFNAPNLSFGDGKALSMIPEMNGDFEGYFFVSNLLSVTWLDVYEQELKSERVAYGTVVGNLTYPAYDGDGYVFMDWTRPESDLVTEDLVIFARCFDVEGELTGNNLRIHIRSVHLWDDSLHLQFIAAAYDSHGGKMLDVVSKDTKSEPSGVNEINLVLSPSGNESDIIWKLFLLDEIAMGPLCEAICGEIAS